MVEFKIGQTYTTRSVCDANCVFSVTIKSRTAKTLTTVDGKTLRVSIRDGVETIKPLGSYSMAPIIKAGE